jgi:thiazole/oxazole-forming peptide maturase SagC family component
MQLDVVQNEQRLTLRRLQLIEIHDGILLKRGRVVVKIAGAEAAVVAQAVLAAAACGATRDELCAPFPAVNRPAVAELIRALEARKILVPLDGDGHATDPDGPLDVFYWHFGRRASEVIDHLNRRPIAIVGVNCVARALARALGATGVDTLELVDDPFLCNVRLFDDDRTLVPETWPVPLPSPVSSQEWMERTDPAQLGCVVATSDFGGQQLLRRWNAYCVEHRVHFLPVVLQDLIGYIGPLVVPGETPCLECLRARQNAHLEDPETQRIPEHVAFEGQGINGFHPAMTNILGELAALELTKFYGNLMPSRLVGRLIEVNLSAPQLQERRILKVPRCRVCSPIRHRSPVSADGSVFLPGHPVGA